MTAETFSPGTKGIITKPSKTYSAGAGRDVASMADNDHLKCTATLPLYITSGSAVSRTNFFALLLPRLYEIPIFGFPWCSTREDLSIDVSLTNVGLILTKLR